MNVQFGNTKKANADLIKRARRDFDWRNELSFIGINDQGELFNETILNIKSNFIPNETRFMKIETVHGLIKL